MADFNYTPSEVTAYLGLIDTYIRWRANRDSKERSYNSYHPSEFGHCLRQQQYRHYVSKGYIEIEKNDFDSRMLRLFDNGHFMHARWGRYFEEIGILRGVWQCNNKLCYMFDDNGKLSNTDKTNIEKILNENKSRKYGEDNVHGIFKPEKCLCGCKDFSYIETIVESKELNMYGHCDVILDMSNLKEDRFKEVKESFNRDFLSEGMVVGDMKSISSESCKNQLERKGPHKYYLIQLTCYSYILGCEYGLLMYENKNNSELSFYKVENNDTWWEAIQYQAKVMQDLASGEKKRLPPPRPDSKSAYECKNCEFRKICHKSPVWDNKNLDNQRKDFYKCLL